MWRNRFGAPAETRCRPSRFTGPGCKKQIEQLRQLVAVSTLENRSRRHPGIAQPFPEKRKIFVFHEKFPVGDAPPDRNGKWDACLSFSNVIGDEAVKFFYPFTTTLLELRLNREPLPLSGANRIAGFLGN